MTESADRSQRPPPQALVRGFTGAVRDVLAKLRGKHLGACASCGKQVLSQQSFTRYQGRTAHVRCPTNAAASTALPLSIDGILARHLTARDR